MLFSKRFIALLLLAIANVATATPRDISAYLMEKEAELELASTAGPKSITDGATYYTLGKSGYEKARNGDNGWHCYVERAWFTAPADDSDTFDARVRAPHCINDEGARTRLQESFRTAELAIEGLTREEIDGVLNAEYAAGELRLPEGLALTYMMSRHQWLGARAQNWKPHMMLWIPYLIERQIGQNELMSGHPIITGVSGSRGTVLVIPVAEFIE